MEKVINKKRPPYMDLKKFMMENCIKQKDMAEVLDKSASALNQNLNGTGGDFSLGEARILTETFGIPNEYFFKL